MGFSVTSPNDSNWLTSSWFWSLKLCSGLSLGGPLTPGSLTHRKLSSCTRPKPRAKNIHKIRQASTAFPLWNWQRKKKLASEGLVTQSLRQRSCHLSRVSSGVFSGVLARSAVTTEKERLLVSHILCNRAGNLKCACCSPRPLAYLLPWEERASQCPV